MEEEGFFSLGAGVENPLRGWRDALRPRARSHGGAGRSVGAGPLEGPGSGVDRRGKPGVLHPRWRTEWGRAGVNRVSLGVQSFQAPALRWLSRLHGPEEPAMALTSARAAGIENLNVDLIFGLPERGGKGLGPGPGFGSCPRGSSSEPLRPLRGKGYTSGQGDRGRARSLPSR